MEGRIDKTMDYAQWLIHELNFVTAEATNSTDCLRKGVGCSLTRGREVLARSYNGPSRMTHDCTNVVGGCGCSHSEPRVIMKAMRTTDIGIYGGRTVMICTYSPCTNCANIILDSGVVCGIVWRIDTQHDMRGAEILRSDIQVLKMEELRFLIENYQQLAEDRWKGIYATLREWMSFNPRG